MAFKKERQHKINSDIKTTSVRLVGEGEPRVISTFEAIKLAQSQEKDLILISDGETPVVRIEEYTKFVYNLEKKLKEQKKNSVQTEIKEIKFGCETDEHDLQTKAKKAIEFLTRGDKVKCLIQLKGRQNAMPERGELAMLKFVTMIEEAGIPEAFPKLEGNKWLMTLKPKPKDKKK